MHLLWESLAIAVGFNLLLLIPAYRYRTDKLTDLSYALSFIIVGLFAYAKSGQSAAHLAVLLVVLLWALRLGGFLFIRIRKNKKDSRFDQMRGRLWRFGRFWLFQGLTVFIVLASALALWNTSHTHINLLATLGLLLAMFGLEIEGLADWQKYRFNQTKEHTTWIDSGLWRI